MKSLSTSPGPTVEYGHKAAFLDRDGVINVDHGYVSRWEDFEFLPGAIEGMRLLQDAGYKLVVVTNQSGIARGYYTEAAYQRLTTAYTNFLAHQGVSLTGVYHCPHHPEFPTTGHPTPCVCRKPRPGLIFYAQMMHGIDLRRSVLFGDRQSDIEAGRAAGITSSYLVSCNPNGFKRNLLECATMHIQSNP